MATRKRVIPRRKQVKVRKRTSAQPAAAPATPAPVPKGSRFEQTAKAFLGGVLEAAERDPEAFVKRVKGFVDKADAAYRYVEENPNAKQELRNRALSMAAGLLRKKITDT